MWIGTRARLPDWIFRHPAGLALVGAALLAMIVVGVALRPEPQIAPVAPPAWMTVR